MSKVPLRIEILTRDRMAGAPFAAWQVRSDYSVVGVTLYTCLDPLRTVASRQAYTARGSRVIVDHPGNGLFTDYGRALEVAYTRALAEEQRARRAVDEAAAKARQAAIALYQHRETLQPGAKKS